MPSATDTLATLAGTVVNTGVGLAQTVFTTYWPYFLVFGVVVGLIVWIKRLMSVTHR